MLASRGEQVSTLILNANDLVGMLSDRRQTIVELLAYTSAVSREVTGWCTTTNRSSHRHSTN